MNKECNHKRYAESVVCRDCEIERLKAELRHALDFDPDGMVSKIKQQAKQIERLKEFARSVIRTECWNQLDGAEIQDVAERCGLIVPKTATKDDVDDFTDYEVGDTIYVFSDRLKETEK